MADGQGRIRGNAIDSSTVYDYFVPYIERAHERNIRGLKAGIWLLFLLPFLLAAIQMLTGASRIVFLIFWIFGMFIIATVLIYAAYSDNDLKKMLNELKSVVPPEREVEIGKLLPVDAEGEGWLIEPEHLPIPLRTVQKESGGQREEQRERQREKSARNKGGKPRKTSQTETSRKAASDSSSGKRTKTMDNTPGSEKARKYARRKEEPYQPRHMKPENSEQDRSAGRKKPRRK